MAALAGFNTWLAEVEQMLDAATDGHLSARDFTDEAKRCYLRRFGAEKATRKLIAVYFDEAGVLGYE